MFVCHSSAWKSMTHCAFFHMVSLKKKWIRKQRRPRSTLWNMLFHPPVFFFSNESKLIAEHWSFSLRLRRKLRFQEAKAPMFRWLKLNRLQCALIFCTQTHAANPVLMVTLGGGVRSHKEWLSTSCFYCVFMCKDTNVLKEGIKRDEGLEVLETEVSVLSFWWFHCTYSDTSHHVCMLCSFKSPLPIFSPPSRLALCGSMCLGKTAFRTNWSQWQKLQGCMSRLHLHGNTRR